MDYFKGLVSTFRLLLLGIYSWIIYDNFLAVEVSLYCINYVRGRFYFVKRQSSGRSGPKCEALCQPSEFLFSFIGEANPKTIPLFRRVCKISKTYSWLRHVRLFIRPPAWNNSAPTRRIFMKFDILEVLGKSVDKNSSWIKI